MRILAAVGTLYMSLAGSAAAGPILLNGSFEDGPQIAPYQDINILGGSTDITAWLVTGERIDYVGSPWDVSDGNRAIDLDGNSGIGGIEQTFATMAGETYWVSFDLSGNPAGSPLVKGTRVSVDGFSQDYFHDSTGQTITNLLWQTISFSFVASGPAATLSFVSLSPSANSYGALIDNVQVEPVPEPTTLAYLLVGLGALGLFRRRGH